MGTRSCLLALNNRPGRFPRQKGVVSMTGRDAAEYILLNRADDVELIINIDGKDIPVYDMVLEPSRTALVILPDDGTDKLSSCRPGGG